MGWAFCTPTPVCRHNLCDAYEAGHATRLVFQDVTVEHPVAGIVGNERDVDGFIALDQDRVLPRSMCRSFTIARDDPERVTV